ncbi:MAG TPA: lectin-like protein, partial [Polyangiaceae bacterium]
GSANNAVQFWDGDQNGSPVMSRYNDWDAGEPNNENNEDCAQWASDHGFHWDDRACTKTYQNLVCETTAAATTN